MKFSKSDARMLYIYPDHTHTSIRVMPGKPHSPLPYQQKPYVINMKDGTTYDKFGMKTSTKNAPEAHIPLEEFVYRD